MAARIGDESGGRIGVRRCVVARLLLKVSSFVDRAHPTVALPPPDRNARDLTSQDAAPQAG